MEEEISLRELIEVVLKGKKIILSITIIAVLIAAILSYFVLSPTYETKATVMVNSFQQEEGDTISTYLAEIISPKVYTERLKSQELLSQVIEKHGLKEWKVQSLRNNLTVETESESNVITMTLKGQSPDLIHKTLDALIEEANIYIGESLSAWLTEFANQYKEQLEVEKDNLELALKEYNEAQAASGLPAIVLLDALTTGGKQYILNVDEKYLEELQALDKDKQVEFQKLNTKVNTLTDLYNKYNQNYEEARSAAKLYNVGNKISVLSSPELPTEPMAPRKTLNMAIAVVFGLMVGVGVVFFNHYWKESGKGSK